MGWAHVMAEGRHSYEKIVKELRAAILGGEELPPGAWLPSEKQLQDRYGVARNTVQRAMNDLVGEGLVAVEPKKGAYVRSYDRQARPVRLNMVNWEFGARVTVELVTTPVQLQAQEPDATGVFRRRVVGRSIGDTYWCRSVTNAVPGLTSPTPLEEADVLLLADAGVPAVEGTAETIARMPTPEESALLDILPGTPVLEQAVMLTSGERILGMRVEVYPGDRYKLVYGLPTLDFPASDDGE
ncbi:GntR family transcriptional regulator [Planomonospora sp. ID82291]|uniref:GntR family transcriptional regulator n=1 Tax=Planomonospora sp. ID82291 TaxID=2738136 RepID=UPI0018C39350|nr:GntR family transcriptional regulator [Planomonospora sp. ID82291]MBG0819000.1 GntR family transcriptional regulator [Planomonospora sp. ID82291]